MAVGLAKLKKPEKSNYLSVGYDDDDEHDLLSSSANLPYSKPPTRSAYMMDMDEFEGDKVRRFLNHLLYCAESQEGFDCYQMISFRRLHNRSRKIKYRRPLKYVGVNTSIPFLSEYHERRQ